MEITRVDTDGVRSILGIGQLGVDNYTAGGDVGRIWTGDGTSNRKLAFHDELLAGSGGGATSVNYSDLPFPAVGNSLYWLEESNRFIYGNPSDGDYYYINTDKRVAKPGQGTGVAGTYTESWEDDTATIMQRWTSDELSSSNNGSSTGYWNRHSGSTGSGGTGPSSAYVGSYYMYTECSSNGHLVDFKLATTDFAKLTEVKFSYHANGAGVGKIAMEILASGNWVEMWSVNSNQGDAWHTATVDCSTVSAEAFRFRHSGATSYTADVAIDKVKVTSI